MGPTTVHTKPSPKRNPGSWSAGAAAVDVAVLEDQEIVRDPDQLATLTAPTRTGGEGNLPAPKLGLAEDDGGCARRGPVAATARAAGIGRASARAGRR